ncbi:MAG TPA: inositol monophosphatase [Jatrophihabitans sp.]|uniref:inositol monophosphatase family protein n=1 Tax=Jatrophihabitans sp. TaxID=1932789 RepID=UPI002EEE7045
MLDPAQLAFVTDSIRRVAGEVVLPRFGQLAAGDIEEKSPGDLVTIADRDAERALAELLTRLLPGSVVVGEEAVAADPAVLQALHGGAPVWIIDPIDGTEAFVTGSPRFATLVALAQRGELLASWTYAPLLELTATAVAGQGAYLNGRPLTVARPAAGLRGLDVALPQPRWWAEPDRERFNALFLTGVSPAFFDTSGLVYVELAAGRRSAMVVNWELPWDHAAGLLLHAEAGGHARTAEGKPFNLAGGNAMPVAVAPDALTASLLLAGCSAQAAQPLEHRPDLG